MARQHAGRKTTPTFRREDRDEFRTMLSIFIARVLSWIMLLMPGPIRSYISARLGSLSYRLSKGYRQNVEANIRRVTGKEVNDAEVDALTRSIFVTNAHNFTDLLTFAWRSRSWFRKRSQIVAGSWESVGELLKEGKGVIFVSAHIGCFDFIGQAVLAHGYPLTVVTGRTTSRFVFDGVTWLRGRKGLKMVEPTPSGVRHVIKALRRNECAVIVADRDFFENGHDVTFFGHPTTLPPGAVRIARDTGAPIVPIFTRRTQGGHEVGIQPPIRVERTRDVKADVRRGMEQLVPALEDGISSCLEQWVMFQRVWPEIAPDPIRIFPTGSPLESELLEKVAQALPEIKLGDESAPLKERGTDHNAGENQE